jgi:hypothetical protein
MPVYKISKTSVQIFMKFEIWKLYKSFQLASDNTKGDLLNSFLVHNSLNVYWIETFLTRCLEK